MSKCMNGPMGCDFPRCECNAGREQFEAWLGNSRRNRGPKKHPNFAMLDDGTYADDHTQRHWWTWQTARASAVPEGYALVPVEALMRWRDAFAEEISAWDIDPPLHHVKTSHDEIESMLAAAPSKETP